MRSISHLSSFSNAANAPLKSLSRFPCPSISLAQSPFQTLTQREPHARSDYVGRTIPPRLRSTEHGVSCSPKKLKISPNEYIYVNFVVNFIYLSQMYGQILPRNIVPNAILDFAVNFCAHCLCITIFSTVNAHQTKIKWKEGRKTTNVFAQIQGDSLLLRLCFRTISTQIYHFYSVHHLRWRSNRNVVECVELKIENVKMGMF